MRPVLERLILSDLSEANDPFFLRTHAIDAILYFGQGGMFGDDIKLYNRPTAIDGELSEDELVDGITFLRESLAAGRRVCAVGTTGATIVVAYLTEMGFSSAQALQMVGDLKGAKPDARTVDSHDAILTKRRETTLGH